MRPPFRLKIGGKICLLSSVIIVATSVITWALVKELGAKVLIVHEMIDHDDDTHLGGRSFLANIQALREDARSLAILVGRPLGDRGGPTQDATVRRNQVEGILANFLRRNSTDSDGDSVKKQGSAYRKSVRYLDASVRLVDGGLIRPSGRKSLVEENPQAAIEAGHFREALASEPQRVRLSEIDPKTFRIDADVPIYPRGMANPVGVVRLSLDLKPMVDEFIESPRSIAFIADEKGRLLASSQDLQLRSQGVSSLHEIEGLKSDIHDFPLAKFFEKRLGTSGLQNQERELSNTGALFKYTPNRKMHLLAIDIEKPIISKKLNNVQFLEGLQEYLDGFKKDEKSKLAVQSGLAEDWPDYYPYAYVRSTDRKRLEEIRSSLEKHPTYGGPTRTRSIVDFEDFEVRLLKLPFDPERQDRFVTLGIGISEAELRGDFEKDAYTLIGPILLVLGGGIAITFLFSGILTGPLKRMTLAAQDFSKGRFEADLPTKAHDEIGVLARAFRVMGEQVRAKTNELQASAARTQTILDMAAEGIVTIDSNGIIESFNRAAEQIYGYPAKEVIGRHVDILLAPHGESQRSSELSRIVAIGQTRPEDVIGRAHELTGRRKDGSEFPMEVSIGEVNLGDQRLFTSIVRDITARKQVEESLRAAEERQRRLNEELDRRVTERTAELEHAKEDLEQSYQQLSVARDATEAAMKAQIIFFDEVAHDLRTPLTNVIGYSQDLLDRASDLGQDVFATDLKLVVNQGAFLNELINDLLNVSKAMSGKELALDITEFDVATMLRSRIPGIYHLADKNENTIELDCPESLGMMVADEVRVWRIIMNLLTNSCKFTMEGTIRVSARREVGPSGDQLVFQIADTGIGMAPEQAARLFNRFEQVHAHSSAQGFGLGLSTCSLYCRTMGGEIRVESEVGKGSTFTVRLPAVVSQASKAALPRPESADVPSTRALSLKEGDPCEELVLIIDDDPSGGELMRRILAEQGIQVRIASSGEQGLLLAKQLRPAAILLDVVMPGIDGWGVLAALKTDAATAEIPIIMVTIVDDRARGFALGADDYATKPLARERLVELLRKHLSNREAERIMVVEDNTEMRDRLVRMLTEQGFEVTQASDGQQALESLAATRPHLILLDLMLPQMNGFEVVERIRRNPLWQEIPIIVVTGAEIDPEDRKRLQGQVKHVLQKGQYGRDELFREVRMVLAELRQRTTAVLEGVDAQNSYG